MQYYLLLQHLTENQVLKQLEALPALIVEEDNQIYNTAGIELSLEGSAAGNMIKTAAKNKEIANAIYSIDGNFASKTKLSC
jgi:hypothetical protein